MFFGHKKKEEKKEEKDELALKFIETIKPEVEEVPPTLQEETTPQQTQPVTANENSENFPMHPEGNALVIKPNVEESHIEHQEPMEEIISKPALFIRIDEYEELQELLEKMKNNLAEMEALVKSYKELHDKEDALLTEISAKLDDGKEKIARILEILNLSL